MKETWKDIPNYKGIYKVSNIGNIKSLSRIVLRGKNTMNIKGKILIPSINNVGYKVVTLCDNGFEKKYLVHQLVAMAFLNHTPNKHKNIIDHIDNNPLNNSFENLQITSVRHNVSKDRKNKTSKYTGVCWEKQTQKWKTSITINGKRKTLGRFIVEKDAHKAYQKELNKITT